MSAPQPEGGTVAPVTFHEGESDADFLGDLAADLESVRDKRRLETIISDGTTERLRKVASSLSARPAADTSGEWERLLLDVMCFVETYGLKHEITAAAREALTAYVRNVERDYGLLREIANESEAEVRRLEEEYFAFQKAARKELATLRKDALTPEQARRFLRCNVHHLPPTASDREDVHAKLTRIASRSTPTGELYLIYDCAP